MLRLVKDPIVSLVFPTGCDVCGLEVGSSADGPACDTCWRSTRFFNDKDSLCGKCGAFFPHADGLVAGPHCQNCITHHYDRAFALGVYEKALSAAIHGLKSSPEMPGRLKVAIGKFLDRISFGDTDIIIPVPLSNRRRVERGFNQAELIARAVGRRTGIDVDSWSLARTRHTQMHRAGMDQRARESTVIDAFEVVRPKLITGRGILLVDDVLTSGSTTSACAQALKKSGAGRVDVFTLARAVLR